MKAWLCLGSNLDNPKLQIEKAVRFLREKCFIKILTQTEPVKTRPFGYHDQPDFVNQLLQVETALTPMDLLAFLKNAESELGRTPTFKWGPRVIDMDIVFYEDEVIDNDILTVPHPGIAEREYLLQLLVKVMPEHVHPVLNLTIKQIYDNLEKEGGGE